MPGELGNCVAGRVANLFNLRGPELHRRRRLRVGDGGDGRRRSRAWSTREFDAVVTGGVDRNMGAVDVRQVLRDRRALGHRHAPVRRRRRRLRDGRGRRGCSCSSASPTPSATATASTPSCAASAARATARARASPRPTRSASGSRSSAPGATPGSRPATCTLVEGHGTSTASATPSSSTASPRRSRAAGLAPRLGRARLGQVQHRPPQGRGRRRRAAQDGLALHDKVLPPSLNFERPEPQHRLVGVAVRRQHRAARLGASPDGAPASPASARSASAGPTSTSCMEEHVPGRLTTNGAPASIAVPAPADVPPAPPSAPRRPAGGAPAKPPLRGALVLGAADDAALANELRTALAEARQGRRLDPAPPAPAALRAPERIAIDYARRRRPGRQGRAGAARAASAATRRPGRRCARAASSAAAARRARSRSSSPARARSTRTCSATLRAREPVVADVFDEADEIMTPLLEGRPLSDIIFVDPRTPRRSPSRASCGGPRSRSPRCWPSTSRSPGCSASTASRRTWSWATASASTARWSPPAR